MASSTAHLGNPPEAQVVAAVGRANGAKVAAGAATNPRLAQSRALATDGSRSETHWSARVALTREPRGQPAQHFCRAGRVRGADVGEMGAAAQARPALPRPAQARASPAAAPAASQRTRMVRRTRRTTTVTATASARGSVHVR